MTARDLDIVRAVEDWLRLADDDLYLARLALRAEERNVYQLAAFRAQQCAEKAMKAYLVFKVVDFPYTHSIRALLNLCADAAPWVESLREAEDLTDYAVTPRYPRHGPVVTKEEAVRTIELATRVREVVRAGLRAEGVQLDE